VKEKNHKEMNKTENTLNRFLEDSMRRTASRRSDLNDSINTADLERAFDANNKKKIVSS